jgi:hypothetical protein
MVKKVKHMMMGVAVLGGSHEPIYMKKKEKYKDAPLHGGGAASNIRDLMNSPFVIAGETKKFYGEAKDVYENREKLYAKAKETRPYKFMTEGGYNQEKDERKYKPETRDYKDEGYTYEDSKNAYILKELAKQEARSLKRGIEERETRAFGKVSPVLSSDRLVKAGANLQAAKQRVNYGIGQIRLTNENIGIKTHNFGTELNQSFKYGTKKSGELANNFILTSPRINKADKRLSDIAYKVKEEKVKTKNKVYNTRLTIDKLGKQFDKKQAKKKGGK